MKTKLPHGFIIFWNISLPIQRKTNPQFQGVKKNMQNLQNTCMTWFHHDINVYESANSVQVFELYYQ